jgi:hypothetical protein
LAYPLLFLNALGSRIVVGEDVTGFLMDAVRDDKEVAMARLAISQVAMGMNVEEQWQSSSFWEDDPITELKQVRSYKAHAGGLAKCSQCGTDVKIHVSPKRNPHSGKLGRTVSLKDHDLCRRCWRQIIRHSRETLLSHDYSSSTVDTRKVA